MRRKIFFFIADDAGAITVDWVVITAAITGFGIGVITLVSAGATDQATGIGAAIGTIAVLTQ